MRTLHVNDINLAYDMVGRGSPLLLLHGLGSSSRDWGLQIDDFARRHRVVACDLRGHGASGKPTGPYKMERFAEDVAALIRELDLGPTHVVGISLGGMVAFQLAIDDPEIVRSLVIVNSAPAAVPRGWSDRVHVWQRLVLLRLFGMRRVGVLIARRLFPRSEQELLRRAFVERMAKNHKPAYLSALRAIIGWSVADKLAQISCPTLVIAGDRDYTPVSLKREYVSKMRHASLVVFPGSGHATPIDRPTQFNRQVLAFLASVERHALSAAVSEVTWHEAPHLRGAR